MPSVTLQRAYARIQRLEREVVFLRGRTSYCPFKDRGFCPLAERSGRFHHELQAGSTRTELPGSVPLQHLRGPAPGEVLTVAVPERPSPVLEQLRMLQSLLDRLPVGVALADGQGNLHWANETLLRLLEQQPDRQLLAALEQPQPDPVGPGRGAAVCPRTVELSAAGGANSWFSVCTASLGNGEPGEPALLLTLSEVTEPYRRLEQQQRFAHSVAHDLRTPLMIIRGHAQLLQRKLAARIGESWVAGGLEAILQATDRLSGMVQELVELAGSEVATRSLELRPLDLSFHLDRLVRARVLVAGQQALELQLTPGLPSVLADLPRLERILDNLIANACRFSRPGAPVIVRAVAQRDEVVVSVSDQGCGIPAGELPYLFEPYRRSETSRKGPGLGLGLYISRLLVEAHGGRIWGESEPGAGSTFFFTLRQAEPGEARGPKHIALKSHLSPIGSDRVRERQPR